jgi:hypothetical protein
MLSKTVIRITELIDTGKLIHQMLYLLLSILVILYFAQGIIGALYSMFSIMSNDYFSFMFKFSSILIAAVYIISFTIAGLLLRERTTRFKESQFRGLIDQWINLFRMSLEVNSVLMLGYFVATSVAVFLSGPEGFRASSVFLVWSFEWTGDAVQEIFSRDSEFLSRLFSFLILIFGVLASWSMYYFGSFFVEVLDTADRFFKRLPHDKQ